MKKVLHEYVMRLLIFKQIEQTASLLQQKMILFYQILYRSEIKIQDHVKIATCLLKKFSTNYILLVRENFGNGLYLLW